MGSTGHSIYSQSRTGNVNTETFGVKGAVNYTGRVPEGKGIEKVGNNKVTLKVNSTLKQDIIFQFKLTKDGRLSINAYNPNQPEQRAHLIISATNPSIDRAAVEGNRSQKSNALKIKSMMAKSEKIDEGQLANIAQKLRTNRSV